LKLHAAEAGGPLPMVSQAYYCRFNGFCPSGRKENRR
jgi:hypothetical protein